MYNENLSEAKSGVSQSLLAKATALAKSMLIVLSALGLGLLVYFANGPIEQELLKALSILLALCFLALLHHRSINL